ncbi:MAG TPA: hypothetical protein DD381_11305 [Lentisphaeria bacterium]|nr:MAG: hypothetical protein A2X47_12810 [Lentisphaerae bacterium GWF2_38_69]HBM16916.1 hypothetical protein [Lentisphaeria bacterium]
MTDLSALKARISCRDVLTHKGIHHPAKGNAPCPICGHGTSTPCFGIYGNGQRYKCFSCNSVGDPISLYQALFKCDFKQALAALKVRAGL